MLCALRRVSAGTGWARGMTWLAAWENQASRSLHSSVLAAQPVDVSVSRSNSLDDLFKRPEAAAQWKAEAVHQFADPISIEEVRDFISKLKNKTSALVSPVKEKMINDTIEKFPTKLPASMALKMFAHIDFNEYKLTPSAATTLMKITNEAEMRHETHEIFDYVVATGGIPSVEMCSQKITALVNSGRIGEATQLHERLASMGIKSCATYNAMLRAHYRRKDVRAMEALWQRMRTSGVEIDNAAFLLMIRSCRSFNSPNNAMNYIKEMPNHGLEPNDWVYQTLVAVCANPQEWNPEERERTLQVALEGLERVGARPTTHTYRYIIGTYEEMGDCVSAEYYFWEMLRKDVKINDEVELDTYSALVHSFCNAIWPRGPQTRLVRLPTREIELNEGMLQEPRMQSLVQRLSSLNLFTKTPKLPSGEILYENVTDQELHELFGGHPIATPPAYLTKMRKAKTFRDPFASEPGLKGLDVDENQASYGRSPAPHFYYHHFLPRRTRRDLQLHRVLLVMEHAMHAGVDIGPGLLAGVLESCSKAGDAESAEKVVRFFREKGLTLMDADHNNLVLAHVAAKQLRQAIDLVLASSAEQWQPANHTYNRLLKALLLANAPQEDVVAVLRNSASRGGSVEPSVLRNVRDRYSQKK